MDKYPIYYIKVDWIQDEDRKDLPKGRIRNSTLYYTMKRTAVTDTLLKQEILDKFWSSYKLRLEKINPSDPIITIEYKYNESWCMGWFSHWTFDNGLSDVEILESFTNYVNRILEKNRNEGEFRKFEDGTSYWHDPYCLMGAEDRWRWCGSKTGDSLETTPPPCRCKHCKDQGVVRINH